MHRVTSPMEEASATALSGLCRQMERLSRLLVIT